MFFGPMRERKRPPVLETSTNSAECDLFAVPRRSPLADTASGDLSLAVVLVAYGATELVEGYGFVAAFVAGLALRRIEKQHEFHGKLHTFTEAIEHALTALLLLVPLSNEWRERRRWKSDRLWEAAASPPRASGLPFCGGLARAAKSARRASFTSSQERPRERVVDTVLPCRG